MTGTRVFKRYQQIHFVGIGGIGMSGIAEVLLNLGYPRDRLRPEAGETRSSGSHGLGAKVLVGHAAANVEGARRGRLLLGGRRGTTPRSRRRASAGSRSSRAPRCSPS